MSDMLPNGTCVVVADGTGAILFENKGGGGSVQLRKIDDLKPINLDDEGPAGKRPSESSAQETDEATFAKQLANSLYSRWTDTRFD